MMHISLTSKGLFYPKTAIFGFITSYCIIIAQVTWPPLRSMCKVLKGQLADQTSLKLTAEVYTKCAKFQGKHSLHNAWTFTRVKQLIYGGFL